MAMKNIGIHEIAKLANVSIGTVDRALHGRKGISEKTRRRILQITERVGYAPNLAARTLSVGRARNRIGVCIPRLPHVFYDQIRDGIMEEGQRSEHLGVEIIYRPIEWLGVGDPERLKEMIGAEIQGLIFTPSDPQQVSPFIDEAESKHIRVVCVASDAQPSARSCVVCVNPQLNGRLAAELMARFVPPGSQVAIITGDLWNDDQRIKAQAFTQFFPQYCLGGKIIDVVEGHMDEDETFQKSYELLGNSKSLGGLYVNLALGPAVCRALGARGMAGKIGLITTDLFKDMVPYFERGTIFASIYQRPYRQGQTAVRLLVDHLLEGQPIPATSYLNPAIVMRSNLYLFRETV